MVNVALLGFGLASDIGAGENRGRQLVHDFVVLDLGFKHDVASTLFNRYLSGSRQTPTRQSVGYAVASSVDGAYRRWLNLDSIDKGKRIPEIADNWNKLADWGAQKAKSVYSQIKQTFPELKTNPNISRGQLEKPVTASGRRV